MSIAAARQLDSDARPPFAAASLMGMLASERVWEEAAALLAHPVWRGRGVPDGGGMPVLVVPGFMAGDGSLQLLRRWLRARNYWTCSSQIRFNVDCTMEAVDRLQRRLERFTDRLGRPAAIVGQSRGGTLAKLVALRRPDLVAGIVALGSPNLDPLAVTPLLARQVAMVAALGDAGMPGFFRRDCIAGDCADEVAAALAQPWPASVPYVSVYSRRDAVVDWRACLDPAAEHVEVNASHIGMGVNPRVYEVLGARLGTLARPTAMAPAFRAAA